jgi:hypothetical protein
LEILLIIFNSIVESLLYLPYIIFITLLIYFFVKIVIRMKDKKQDIKIDEELDVFGFKSLNDERKFKEDLEDIKKSISSGEGQIKVEFSKAMYILKNFNDYNFFSSEDNKIIFEKLKTIIDNEMEIENNEMDHKLTEIIKTEKGIPSKSTEILEDGSVKVNNPNGYTILKDNVIIDSKNYAVEEKKKQADDSKNKNFNINVQELEKKVTSIEENLLHTNMNKKKKEKKVLNEPITKSSNVTETLANMNDDITAHFKNFKVVEVAEIDKTYEVDNKENSDESNSDKQKNENEFLRDIKTKYDLLEDYNIVFILESFHEEFIERIYELVDWLLDVKSLYDIKNKFMFCDIDVDKKLFYIDVNLFLYLFFKNYKDKSKIEKVLLYSGEVINIENLRKILNKINQILYDKYENDFFIFIGKTKSPFTERILSYELENENRIISAQMLMINLEIEEESFNKKIYAIKTDIISINKPKTFKASIKNKNEIKNLGYSFFKNIDLL